MSAGDTESLIAECSKVLEHHHVTYVETSSPSSKSTSSDSKNGTSSSNTKSSSESKGSSDTKSSGSVSKSGSDIKSGSETYRVKEPLLRNSACPDPISYESKYLNKNF